jgi:hypothetical protein
MDNKFMVLAGVTFLRMGIDKLPEDIVDDIRKNGRMVYLATQCHNNAIQAAARINYKNTENRIVEGLVKRQDGLLFEHFWNRVVAENDSSDFDITLDVIGSFSERNTLKSYYEYCSYSISDMEERKTNSHNAFSPAIIDAIADYYTQYPELKEQYDYLKEQIG